MHHSAKEWEDVDRSEVTTGLQFRTPQATTLDISGVKKPKVALLPLLTPLDEAAKDTAITSIIGRG